jgi:hypothetical protein
LEIKEKIDLSYEGYLTEQKLGEIFLKISEFKELRPQYTIQGTRLRVDYRFLWRGMEFWVEYDGPQHYTDLKVILRDVRVRDLAEKAGVKLIRIPYFVQLSYPLLNTLFNGFPDGYCIDIDYPDGFIDSEIYPSYFHTLGHLRYLVERFILPVDFPKVDRRIFNKVGEDFLSVENWYSWNERIYFDKLVSLVLGVDLIFNNEVRDLKYDTDYVKDLESGGYHCIEHFECVSKENPEITDHEALLGLAEISIKDHMKSLHEDISIQEKSVKRGPFHWVTDDIFNIVTKGSVYPVLYKK